MVGDWDYSASFTRGEYRLDQNRFARWKDKIEGFFGDTVLGRAWAPPLMASASTAGLHRVLLADHPGPVRQLHRLWHPSQQDLAEPGSRAGDQRFAVLLPGGDAGLAVVLEGGSEGWDYSPDQAFVDGSAWGATAVVPTTAATTR